MIELIQKSWGWLGIEPATIIDQNKFGNIIFKDKRGKYWRICPEELLCVEIAHSEKEYNILLRNKDFTSDWNMTRLVDEAERKFGGPQPDGRCFCLKIPGVLGGAYNLSNIGTISISEIIKFSGDIAQQIKDLPNGSKIKFQFVD